MGRKYEDLEGQGLKVNKPKAACQSLCQCPFQLLIHGSAEVTALVAHLTHFHTPLKKKRTSLMTSGMHPQGINFAASGVDFTISAEFGCKLEGTSRFAQREYSFNQVYAYL